MTLLIIFIVVVAGILLGYWIWRKVEDAIIEAEINRIKIPDDTPSMGEKPEEKKDQRKTV